MNIGPQSKSDRKDIARYRLFQSEYRLKILKEKYGFGPNKNSKTRYGNMLINGEETGSNFISDTAFRYAKQKALDKQINQFLTIDEYRLFNNMLSSQPMCFNLFSDLRALLLTDPETASSITRQLFSEITWIDKLTYVDVEFIPVPIRDYTNDKTAFDAMLLVMDKAGRKGLITVETKYTDVLGDNPSVDTVTKDKLVRGYRIFDDSYRLLLKKTGYKQIHRNYLLTVAYAKAHKVPNYANIIISPELDQLSEKEIGELKEHLGKKQETLLRIPLEDLVQRGVKCGDRKFAGIMRKLKQRYIPGKL